MISAMSRCAISTSPAPIPKGRLGQSTPNATHLIKRGVQTALGRYPQHGHFRRGLPDPRRHLRARLHPGHRPHRRPSRRARLSARRRRSRRCCNCGYGHGATVKEVDRRRQARLRRRFQGQHRRPPRRRPRRHRRHAPTAYATCSAGGRSATISTRSCARRSTGSGACTIGSCEPTRAAADSDSRPLLTRARDGLSVSADIGGAAA